MKDGGRHLPHVKTPAATGTARVEEVLRAAHANGELSQADLDLALERLGLRRAETKQAKDRRQDIVRAAIGVFSRKGYNAATLQDIAAELGLTPQAFYYYFKSKQEILEAISHGAADATDKVIETALAKPGKTHIESLRRLLHQYAFHMAGQETTGIMMRNYEEMSPAEQAEISARRRRREQLVLDLIKRGVAAGELHSGHPRIALICAFEAIHAMHLWYREDGPLSREEVVSIIVDHLLRGFASR